MPANRSIEKALRQLETESENLSFPDSVQLIDRYINDPSNRLLVPHAKVFKAGVLQRFGYSNEALQLLEQSATEHSDCDSANYFAGEALVEAKAFSKAIEYLDRCLELARLCNESWFLESAHLLVAYCAAKTGNSQLAKRHATQIGDDAGMEWLDTDPEVSKRSIERMIVKLEKLERIPGTKGACDN